MVCLGRLLAAQRYQWVRSPVRTLKKHRPEEIPRCLGLGSSSTSTCQSRRNLTTIPLFPQSRGPDRAPLLVPHANGRIIGPVPRQSVLLRQYSIQKGERSYAPQPTTLATRTVHLFGNPFGRGADVREMVGRPGSGHEVSQAASRGTHTHRATSEGPPRPGLVCTSNKSDRICAIKSHLARKYLTYLCVCCSSVRHGRHLLVPS